MGTAATDSIGAEYELVLRCARLDPEPTDLDAVRRLLEAGDVQWDEVLRLADWHQVTGFLHVFLRRPEVRDGVPAPVIDLLQRTHLQNRMRNLFLRRELQRALEVLGREGVPVVLLKGSALLCTVYGDPGVRPMADLDLLVREEQLDRSCSALAELGYRPDRHDAQLGSRSVSTADRTCNIDLHRSLKLPYDVDLVWQRGVPVEVGGAPALVPAAEEMVVQLAGHFLGDRKYKSTQALRQLADVTELVRRAGDRLDWDHVVREVQRNDIHGRVYIPLLAATELLDAPVPPAALAALRPPDLDDAVARGVIDRRVLRAQPWFSVELLQRNKRPFRTVFPDRERLEAKYGGRVGPARAARLYGRRVMAAARLGGSTLVRLRELARDAWLNRKLSSYWRD